MVARTGVFGALTEEHRERLMCLAREVSFETDERVFDAGGKADRFWTIRTGAVALDVGARADSPARAYEFDAATVREKRGKNPGLRHELCMYVAGVIAGRLRSARVRLLDLYAPQGAGEVPSRGEEARSA